MRETTTHAPIIAGARETARSPHFVRLRWLLGTLWRAHYELIGLALLLEAAVGVPVTIALIAGYDASMVLLIALAAAWGAFLMAVVCAIREVRRYDRASQLPGRG